VAAGWAVPVLTAARGCAVWAATGSARVPRRRAVPVIAAASSSSYATMKDVLVWLLLGVRCGATTRQVPVCDEEAVPVSLLLGVRVLRR